MDAITILLKAKDEASKVLDKVKSSMGSLAKDGLGKFKQSFDDASKSLMVGVGILGGGLIGIAKKSIDASVELERQSVVLDIIAERYGQSGKKAAELAKTLGKELRIGVGSASESLQYLIKSGLSLDQAQDMLRRFTNEAITGKSANISLSDAVRNLAFAYNTGNSALGNLSGISENFSDIEKKGLAILQKKGELLGKSIGQLTEAERMQARYAGMISLTNDTMGASERLLGTTTDLYGILGGNVESLYVQIGQKLEPAYKELLKILIEVTEAINVDYIYNKVIEFYKKIVDFLSPAIEKFKELNKDGQLVNSMLAGIAGTGILLLINGLLMLAGAMFPITLLISLIGSLYFAFNNNFLGIKDLVTGLVDFFRSVFFPILSNIFQSIINFVIINLMPAFFSLFNSLLNLWNVVSPLLIPVLRFLAILLGAILVQSVFAFLAALTVLANITRFVVDSLVVGFNFVKNNFLNFVQLAISLVNGNWRVAMSSLFSIAKSAVDGISSLFGNLARTIGSIAKAISDTVGKAASIGSSIQGKIPGFAVGTSYFPGGIADVHKDERVILPAGAKVQTAATANRERQKEQASNSISFSPVINFNGFTKPNREEIKEIFDDLKPEFIKFLQQKQVM